jgi:hypothetical protein
MDRQKQFSLIVFVFALFAGGSILAENPVKTLHTPVTVRGLIGGESHDSYAIQARAGQSLSLVLSWRPEHDAEAGNNHAEFSVSDSPDFGGHAVAVGRFSEGGKCWVGKIPKTGTYYVYVMGYPTVRYILKVALN